MLTQDHITWGAQFLLAGKKRLLGTATIVSRAPRRSSRGRGILPATLAWDNRAACLPDIRRSLSIFNQSLPCPSIRWVKVQSAAILFDRFGMPACLAQGLGQGNVSTGRIRLQRDCQSKRRDG